MALASVIRVDVDHGTTLSLTDTCFPSSQICASHLPVLQSSMRALFMQSECIILGTCSELKSSALLRESARIAEFHLQWCVTPLKRDEVPGRRVMACFRLIPPLLQATAATLWARHDPDSCARTSTYLMPPGVVTARATLVRGGVADRPSEQWPSLAGTHSRSSL